MTTVAIWNPASGSTPDEAALQEALGAHVQLVPTTPDDPGTGQTDAAIDAGADLVVACGGDGTVRACLEPLVRSSAALGIVPMGTGNLLAANLDLQTGLGAGGDVGRGSRRRIDTGVANGEAFAVMAGTGFDAHMIRDAHDTLKKRTGSLAYVVSGLGHLRSATTPTTVRLDGREWFRGRSSMVLVGNFGEVSGGVVVFPDARPDDGALDVLVVAASTVREWALLAWRLLRGRPVPRQLARRTQARSVRVELGRPRAYELDGEDRPPTSVLDIEVVPDSLTIHQARSEGGP